MKRPTKAPAAPTVDQLVAVVRQYQRANGPDRLADADAAAVALIGEAPLDYDPPTPRRRKTAR